METEVRTIMKYSVNRKLYDKTLKRYVNLHEVAQLVKAGETVQVIDNKTKADITSDILKRAYFEQLKLNSSLTNEALHNKIKSI